MNLSDSKRKRQDQKSAEVLGRIEELRRHFGISQRDLCIRIGFNFAKYKNLATRGGLIPMDLLAPIASELEANSAWLLLGEGPMLKGGTGERSLVPVGPYKMAADDDQGGGYVLIPRYEIEGSTGPGAFPESETIVDWLAFRSDWIHGQLGGRREDFFLMGVRGDSMEPTLRTGDVILVDRRDTVFQASGAIYTFRVDKSLFVKRVRRKVTGQVEIVADNAAYPVETMEPGAPPADLTVLGRVVWHARLL